MVRLGAGGGHEKIKIRKEKEEITLKERGDLNQSKNMPPSQCLAQSGAKPALLESAGFHDLPAVLW